VVDMEKTKTFLTVMGIIALRKGVLYKKIMEKEHVDGDKLQMFIAKMDNNDFISPSEKLSKKINPNTALEDLNIEIKSIVNKIR
jgi:hypothetical protein